MIIKKFQATTENEAIILAKEELGPEAIVMNVKTIKPRGIFRLFRKNKIELTAAIDDNVPDKQVIPTISTGLNSNKQGHESYRFGNAFANTKEDYSEETQNAIEEKINNIAKLLEQQMKASNVETKQVVREDNSEVKDSNETNDKSDKSDVPSSISEEKKSKVIDLIYNQLTENEVSDKYINAILDELDYKDNNQQLDNILASIYQKIVLKLGEIKPLTPPAKDKKPKIVFFVGNTGVGKTTTMAKLASVFNLEEKMKIAMLSVDTYRIAAIEQIKTYANILNTPMKVVYTPEEMKQYINDFSDCDLIFVDTAGRSHNNNEQKNDLSKIIECVEGYEKEIFLVVSATTKYTDLINIAKSYGEMFDYKIIFTKLDETRGLGNILNLKLDTNKPLSYVTWGQNVPDDMGLLNPQIIAKQLLGGTK